MLASSNGRRARVERGHAGLADDRRAAVGDARRRRGGPSACSGSSRWSCRRPAGTSPGCRRCPGCSSTLASSGALGDLGRRPATTTTASTPRKRLTIDSSVRILRARMPCSPMIRAERKPPESPITRTPAPALSPARGAGRRRSRRSTRDIRRGVVGVVGDQDQPAAPLGGRLQRVDDQVAGLGVQRAGRLVGQQHPRVADQGPGDRDPLLLATGQPRRPVLGQVRDADLLERLAAPWPGACGAAASPGR